MMHVMSMLHQLSILMPAGGKYHQSCHSNYQIQSNKIYDLPVRQARASDYRCLNEDLLLNLFEDFQGDTSNWKMLTYFRRPCVSLLKATSKHALQLLELTLSKRLGHFTTRRRQHSFKITQCIN